MKKIMPLLSALLVSTSAHAQEKSAADKLGWQLAIHSYTFQKYSIFDAIDKSAALGVKYMSVSGGLMLDGTNRITTVELPDTDRAAIDKKLRADGFGNFVNIGV